MVAENLGLVMVDMSDMEVHPKICGFKKLSKRKRTLDVGEERPRPRKIKTDLVNDDSDGANTKDDDVDRLQLEEAAENLIWMSRMVLDVESATNLLQVQREIKRTHVQEKPKRTKLPKKQKVENQDHDDEPLQELPQFGYQFDGTKLPRTPPVMCLEGLIENCSMPFVKQLTNTDLKKTHNRLSLNKEEVKRAILPVLNSLNYNSHDLAQGISVRVYDSEGRTYKMVFKTWVGEKVYVLNTVGWKEFVSAHNLIGYQDWISVWMFSHKSSRELCFALTIQRFATPKPITKRRLENGLEID